MIKHWRLIVGIIITIIILFILGMYYYGMRYTVAALEDELKQYEGNELDTTLLEVAISNVFQSDNTYDIQLNYWADNLSSEYINFEISGKAHRNLIDLSQID